MKLRSFFVAVLFVFVSSGTSANGVQDIEALRKHILEYAKAHYLKSYGKEKFERDVEISVGRLDSRLRLAKCDDNLEFSIRQAPQSLRNITMKATCNQQHRWTIYVPTTIDIYGNILVAKRSLQKGDTLTADDLEYRRHNLSVLGHGSVEDLARVSGMELKRPLKAGDTLKHSYMRKLDIVRRGQTVLLTSQSRFLSVEAEGIALGSGHMGEQIKVKNQRSNRIVNAKVVAPGKVIVAIR